MALMPVVPKLSEVDLCQSLEAVHTGDLVLFSGRGLASDTVRLFTRSYWSHIGLVLRLPGVPQPLVLESTTLSDSKDLFQQRPVRGIGLVPLLAKVQEYPGDVALRRWQGAALSAAQQQLLARLALRLRHRPYKNYLLCHLRNWFGASPGRDYSAMFCSELVAELYRRVGRLPATVVPHNFVPGDFAADKLPFIGGQPGPLLRLRAVRLRDVEQNPALVSCS